MIVLISAAVIFLTFWGYQLGKIRGYQRGYKDGKANKDEFGF